MMQPRVPSSSAASYSIFSEESQPGVLQRVGSAAGMLFSLMPSLMLFPNRVSYTASFFYLKIFMIIFICYACSKLCVVAIQLLGQFKW